jgi:ribosome-associated protein
MNKDLQTIVQALYDKKGLNTLVLDLSQKPALANYFIIGEGTSERHLGALANSIMDALEKHGSKPLHVEGLQGDSWIVLDYGEIIVHLFLPEIRSFYALEDLWNDVPLIDIQPTI